MKTPTGSARILCLLFALLLPIPFTPAAVAGDDETVTNQTPPPARGTVADSYRYMAELALAPSNAVDLDLVRLAPIVDYLLTHPDAGRDLHPLPELDTMAGAYHSFSIARPLRTVLTYAYNPEIPQVAFRPTSIRLTYWSEINGRQAAAFPRLWPLLADMGSPHQLRGRELTEITPDLFSGAYFQYELDTRIILMSHAGRRIFLSISKQPERSEVGKKGAIVGGDQSWNYLYTSAAGLAKPGLGWVKSYIYDSLSVVIYAEAEGDGKHIDVGIFKWLNAGWAGMNMVKPKHIHEGLLRFADPFKQLLEHPDLPAPEWLATYFRPLGEMATEELRERARRYHQRLQTHYADHPPFNNAKQAKLFGDPAYADGLDRIQLEAMLAKDYVKPIFGKESLLDTLAPRGADEPSE